MSLHLFYEAAALAAHSNYGSEGFRQRDFRFLLELFLNWMSYGGGSAQIRLHNTQMQRFLESLVTRGFARRTLKAKSPRYRLTRPGLLHLVADLTRTPPQAPLDHFYFVYYFIRSYHGRVRELIAEDGAIPHAFEVELRSLFDDDLLLQRQLRFVENELQKLTRRQTDALEAAKLSSDLARKGVSSSEIAEHIEKQYPYELNNQKPLSELLKELPKGLRDWELSEGNRHRGELIFAPLVLTLRHHRDTLRALARNAAAEHVNRN